MIRTVMLMAFKSRFVTHRRKPRGHLRIHTRCRVLLTASVLASLVAAGAGYAAPASLSVRPQTQTEESCAEFDSRVWAQSVFEESAGRYAALDPDGDGLACEELVPGMAPALWTRAIPAGAVPVALVTVVDGDTLVVEVDGAREPVRLIGVDAPEAGGPYQQVECFGAEAAGALTWLAGSGDLFIELDREERDRYGRLLRWVWLDLGNEVYLLNEALLRAGYAARFRDTPNQRYLVEMTAAEAFARRHALGLWSACANGVTPSPIPVGSLAPPSGPGASCDRSYPDVCIPFPPPDLDCRDVPHVRFRVLTPDPHQFDGNRDGVGCEGPP
jgi:micrococcal nuclease